MENNKTISELNGKAWYRALKVIYIFYCFLCFLLAGALSYGIGSYFYENSQDYLTEQVKNQKLITEIKDLKAQGYTSEQISDKVIEPRTGYSPYILNEINGGNFDHSLYDTQHQEPASIYWLLLIVPCIFLVGWLISVIPKVIFYYVYLGTIKPKK